MYVVRKKSLTALKKVASFQQVSNGLSFVELRGMGVELQTKKYMAEVQRENNEQFNYYTECVSDVNKIIQN
mgnify:CR=1 FL=1